jgi:hypothetical protein
MSEAFTLGMLFSMTRKVQRKTSFWWQGS